MDYQHTQRNIENSYVPGIIEQEIKNQALNAWSLVALYESKTGGLPELHFYWQREGTITMIGDMRVMRTTDKTWVDGDYVILLKQELHKLERYKSRLEGETSHGIN